MHTDPQTRGRQWLESKDVRPTKQRLALATLLVGDGKNRHVTAESLHEAVSDTEASVSLATVYNTLRLFCDAELMNEITVDGNKSYFDTRTDQHPHFFWEGDRKLTDAPTETLKFESIPTPPDGMEIASVDVVIRLRKRQ
ncbi:transcriptional repressor [Amylibacter sp. SFDW26]|uniref:Fur family transcriptional regulator Irr n=1 Tax=Amylibacter sp. SFDW26 TaxID=2652722 RepID=UPI0012622ECF|nr:transcriptional repressor [Amylibacter sp. SFDW26]KAB7613348.1 transcriptional repressor [Amylibacter sp. SFDW26]